MHEFQLTAPIGFTFDTSLAVARCIYDGFFDRYPNLKLIASHGGGALPYLVGRLDICWDNIPAAQREDRRAAAQLHAPHLRRQRRVPPGRARHVRLGVRHRQRALRLGLSAHHRRHGGLPVARRCPARPARATRCAAGTPSGSSSSDPLAQRRRRQRPAHARARGRRCGPAGDPPAARLSRARLQLAQGHAARSRRPASTSSRRTSAATAAPPAGTAATTATSRSTAC